MNNLVKKGWTKFDYVINNTYRFDERKKLETTNLIKKFKNTHSFYK